MDRQSSGRPGFLSCPSCPSCPSCHAFAFWFSQFDGPHRVVTSILSKPGRHPEDEMGRAQRGPFRLRFVRVARRRGPPGGCGSGTARIGRALMNSASTISGVDQFIGPHRVNRCSLSESSLVNRNTILGAGPSIDATTISSRATSSATHLRPLGSVYRAAKARRSEWSMSSSK